MNLVCIIQGAQLSIQQQRSQQKPGSITLQAVIGIGKLQSSGSCCLRKVPVTSARAVQMRRSTVVGSGGKSVEDNIRTSYGTFLRRAPLLLPLLLLK